MTYSLKITAFYFLGLILLGLFFWMDNSKDLSEFLHKADGVRTDWGFGFYVLIGLSKLVLLVAGISIPLTLTFLLIRRKVQNKA